MKVYTVKVKLSSGFWFGEKWLFEADTLGQAVAKAETKLRRGKLRYEGWSVDSAQQVEGTLHK